VKAVRGDRPYLLRFEAEGFTLLVDIEAGAGRYTLMGQIIAADLAEWRGAMVECRQDKQVVSTAFVNEVGIFRCELADSRPVRLRIIPETGRPIFVQDFRQDS
jgi:hypothetical protein